MKLAAAYPWPGSLEGARALQNALAARVSVEDDIPPAPRFVAGVDVSPPDAEGWVRGAVVVLRFPDLSLAEVRVGRDRPSVPYIPGYLAFREVPAVSDALRRIETVPDVILVDGQGLAHPRRFGLACHLGLVAGLPTVGCAKSRLLGRFDALGEERGSAAPLVHGEEIVGAAVRTRSYVSPIYVSIGHRVSLDAAARFALACCSRYRVPEPTRMAHFAAAGRFPEGIYGIMDGEVPRPRA